MLNSSCWLVVFGGVLLRWAWFERIPAPQRRSHYTRPRHVTQNSSMFTHACIIGDRLQGRCAVINSRALNRREVIKALIVLPSMLVAAPALARDAEAAKAAYAFLLLHDTCVMLYWLIYSCMCWLDLLLLYCRCTQKQLQSSPDTACR